MMEKEDISRQLAAIWPEVIGVVITKQSNKINLCPINFQAVSTSYEQPLSVCLGLDNRNLTIENVLATCEFVYAYPSKAQLKDVIHCGTVSGRGTDKLADTTLTFEASETVAPPRLHGAVLNYECKLVHSYNAGQFTIVVGQIQKIIPSGLSNLDKIYTLGGTSYGVIRGIDVLPTGH